MPKIRIKNRCEIAYKKFAKREQFFVFENIVEIKNSKGVNWLIRDVFVFDDTYSDRRDKWLTSDKETVKTDVYYLIELSKLQYLSVEIR